MQESICFAANIENLVEIMSWITEKISLSCLSEKSKKQLSIALEESIVNILSYAYPQKNGSIEIIWEKDLQIKMVRFTLKDQGLSFNPLAHPVPDKNASLEKRPIGGLGVFLLNSLTDHVEYKREENTNILILSKNMDAIPEK